MSVTVKHPLGKFELIYSENITDIHSSDSGGEILG